MDDDDSKLSRRSALKGLGAGVAVAAGCGQPDRCAGGVDELPPPADVEEAEARRRLAGIDTFVVLMFENRSFDHVFGALGLDPRYPDCDRIDGITGVEWNPNTTGEPVQIHRQLQEIPTKGPERNWILSRLAYNEGRNDGFVRANSPPHDLECMTYHDREVAPLFYALADRYTVCDRWFASVMGPTWPNRFYLHAATSNGRTANIDVSSGEPLSVWERMAERCHSAKNYYAGVAAWYSVAFAKRSIGGGGALIPERIEGFFRDARNGTLPNFSVIDPDFHITDLHPPHSFAVAEPFLGAVVRALEESPQWPRTMLVVTFDEHGGFFDHLPPPQTVDSRPEFRQLGFRVPTLVIGPSVWQGRAVSTTLEHVSVLATLRRRFGITSLGSRMDAATDLSSCVDPGRLESSLPRLRQEAPLVIGQDLLRACCAWESSQEELERAVSRGEVADCYLDRRPADERMRDWLGPAQDLGAVRILR